jgi:hypothetical protein
MTATVSSTENSTPEPKPGEMVLIPHVPQKLDVIAGILSYLLPGLGQISQGRFSKGIVFFVALQFLFYYGMFLGDFKNVYVAPSTDFGQIEGAPLGTRLKSSISARVQILGQFFIGMSAWPALYQGYHYDGRQDVEAQGPHFGKFMRYPGSEEINRLQRDNDKLWDLGWVYTVIAGVLNILVIYDAMAGPAFREVTAEELKKIKEAAKS